VDVGAALVRILARPLRAVESAVGGTDDVAEIRSRASRQPANVAEAVDGLTDRMFAWLMLTAGHVLLAVVLDLLERILPKTASDFLWSFFEATLVICGMTAVLVSIRFVIGYYTDEERWPTRRRTLTSGNKDLAISTIVVVLFVLLLTLG
jgi:hypothetical protein